MKKSDIAMAGCIAIIGFIIAYFLVNALLGDPNDEIVTFKYVANEIPTSLTPPDTEVFNSDAINPTVEVYVGNCPDIDQDQTLSLAEKVSCGQITASDAEQQAKQQQINNNGGENTGEISEEESNSIDNLLRDIQERNADRTNE